MFDTVKCKRGHLRSEETVYYTRPNGWKSFRCRACFNLAKRLKYRKNDDFRKYELARCKNYYHMKVKDGQKGASSSSEA